ncbi:hypothetical protein CVD28_00020 [Bacillus sp. M6-12]|uniref:hypothetical protein n=1 Tax=Bacillus sp. M6-12 TaxID=2054166 RepID=UPI000C78259D|nr:hypothetical protein [Bacillus sp. M6-12]PLS18825.1 hypothetical protein CVD28_00020 [Bacillus sp. M6-12]
MYQYMLTQGDKIPVLFQHKEKIPQKDFLNMFNTCISLYHEEGKTKYNHEMIANLMKEKFGFEEVKIETILHSPSDYPGLFDEGYEDKVFKENNIIQIPFGYGFWKQNKKEG